MNDRPKPLVIADAKEDKNGNLWFADLDEGIILYNSKTQKFSKPFTKMLGERNSMAQILYYHNRIYSFSGPQFMIGIRTIFRLKKSNYRRKMINPSLL